LAGEGLPNSGNVGFEIFDRSDFRTSQFVQQLNYQRALQGELARTINQFEEVKQSRVFIVIPKDSLFVEDRKPASASIQLELYKDLPPDKLSAIIHLVANAVEGLEPDQVSVVDTRGRVIFKGRDDSPEAGSLSSAQLDYKWKIENDIRNNVQSMLEKIVGAGKAIVRVTSEIDFNKETLSAEEYDPDATAVRSSRDIQELFNSGAETGAAGDPVINQRAGIMPEDGAEGQSRTKRDVSTNYEINRLVKTVVKPAGSIRRLSVAAVIDGRYEPEKQEDGTVKSVYVPRTDEEIGNFEEIVKRAMGYNEDREDQVSVRSIAFSRVLNDPSVQSMDEPAVGIREMLGEYRQVIVNLFLVLLIFFLIVRPLLKSFRNLPAKAVQEAQPQLAVEGAKPAPQLAVENNRSQHERVISLIESNPEKTQQLIRSWLKE
jgi:flagellar M-ring protein FliF